MYLCVIRPGAEYRVCVVPNGSQCSDCQVLDQIRRLSPKEQQLQEEIWAGIYEDLPIKGLPDSNGTKQLQHGIHELRFGRLPGRAFRILWFEGETPVEIICSYAFVKGLGDSTPQEAQDKARWHQKLFRSHLTKGNINRINMSPADL